MAGSARRLGGGNHRALQRACTRATALVRLRSEAVHGDRSRYRRGHARLHALAVLSWSGENGTYQSPLRAALALQPIGGEGPFLRGVELVGVVAEELLIHLRAVIGDA